MTIGFSFKKIACCIKNLYMKKTALSITQFVDFVHRSAL
jgi:hypothetical protein